MSTGARLVVVVIAILLLHSATAHARFSRATLPVQTWKLFDFGVTDIDGDGRLDPFTVNHKFDASMLRGTRSGWADVYDRIGLSPSPAFPGFESIHSTPPLDDPGLYVYATFRPQPGDPFHLRAIDRAASGSIAFAARSVQVERVHEATAAISQTANRRTVEFDIEPGGALDIAVDHHDLPLKVSVDPPLPPSEIKVGAAAIPASARGFDLRLRDRHGYGFADFDGDGHRDVLIASGGLGGNIGDPFYAGAQTVELLLRRGRSLVDRTAGSGLEGSACRSRSVDLADLDGDGNLDVLIGCEEAPPRTALGEGTGRFATAPSLGQEADVLRLIDASGDQRPELLAIQGREATLWRFAESRWRLLQRTRLLNRRGRVTHIALGDVDGNGRLDAMALSPRGNTLLLGSRNGLKRRAPAKALGLPKRGTVAGAFVDFDNDGDLDAHLLPRGLFERKANRYRRTGKLAHDDLPAGPVRSGIVHWADLDGDGLRDPSSVRGAGSFTSEQLLDTRRNESRSGSWLHVDLHGTAGNREAIGAKVRVRGGGLTQTGWVGQSDDSAHSTGHYRLYFGLGQARRARRVVVRWPDGEVTARRGVRLNRLLAIEHPDAS